MNINRVILVGNLTQTPELKHTNSGAAVCDLRMAVNNKRGSTEETLFTDVTVWGVQAENCCKYLSKGRNIGVDGRLKLDAWEDDNGQKRTKISVVADNVQFGNNPDSQQEDAKAPSKEEEAIAF